MRQALLATIALLTLAGAASAAEVKHIGPPMGMIAQAVVVPPGSTTMYISGMTATPTNAGAPRGTPPTYGDTEAQTISILTQMQDLLKGENMTMGDVVMMRVYMAPDPAKDNKIDFAGMNTAFKTFFGTTEQPNKPARVTFQVGNLVGKSFIEIEAQAAKAPGPMKKVMKKTTTTTTTTKK